MERSSGSPPSDSTAFHGSVSSTCSTPSVATNAIFFPFSLRPIHFDYRTRPGTKRTPDLARLRATMATRPPRTQTREEQRRLSIRTLLIASVASAAAAVVTSQFWVHGTWIAAAMTPVIVSLVSEVLHRPTEAVARRITTDRPAVLPPREPGREGDP